MEPQQGVFEVGDEIELVVKLKSDKDINAIEAKIKIVADKDIIEVVDIPKSDSLIPIWISEPAFIQEEKVIDFAGVIPSPGFKGEGKVVSIRLEAKKPGEVIVEFPSASILANDGKGTDILEKKVGAKYLIVDNSVPSPDLNSDGKISISDISILISNWGTVNIETTVYDLNIDGKINLLDISILISKITTK